VVNTIDTAYFMLSSRPPDPPCRDASDIDDTGYVGRDDLYYLLDYLFNGGPEPPAPFPACGPDPTDDNLGCDSFPPCDNPVVGKGGAPLGDATFGDGEAAVRLAVTTTNERGQIVVPLEIETDSENLVFELNLSFDPSAVRFVGFDDYTDFDFLAATQTGRTGTIHMGGIADLGLDRMIPAGKTTLGQLLFEVRDASSADGSRIDLITGFLVSEDLTLTRIESNGFMIGEDSTDSISRPSFRIPNPIRPNSTLSLALPQSEQVMVTIFNVRGQRIRTLLNRNLSSGQHDFVWDCQSDTGQEMGPGIYYIRAKIGQTVINRKVVLVR